MKNRIIQNFIARTNMMLRSVMALWDLSNYQDCWILHRCLVDRLFHLFALGKNGAYEAFDGWSFMRQFEAQNRVRSDPNCQNFLDSPLFMPTPEQRNRYTSMAKSPPQWKRPKAEDTAKEMRLPFLYTYSYDYASAHVHPMANDGSEDFFTITKLEPRPDFPSHISVLHNSLLVGCLIVQEALNQSDFRWRSIIYDFLDDLMQHLLDGSPKYQVTFCKFAELGPDTTLCEPGSSS